MMTNKYTEEQRKARGAAVKRYNDRYPERVKTARKKSREVFKQNNPLGYRAYRRKMDLRRKGLSVIEFDAILEKQQNRCVICQRLFGQTQGTMPHIDHDHICCPQNESCGRCIRGLLCSHCNMGLGRFRDSPELLTLAAAYLIDRGYRR